MRQFCVFNNLAFDSEKLNAWSEEAEGSICFWLNGGDEHRLESPNDIEKFKSLFESRPEFVEVAPSVRINTLAVAAFLPQDPEGCKARVYLEGTAIPFPAPSMVFGADYRTFPHGLKCRDADIVGWDAGVDELFLRSGHALSLEDPMAIEGLPFLNFRKDESLWMRADALVACRKNLSGPLGEAQAKWVLFLQNTHHLAAKSAVSQDPWITLADGSGFDPQAITAYAEEKPAHPGALHRLAIYLTYGFEMNFYGEDADRVMGILPTDRSSSFMHLSHHRGFSLENTVALRWAGETWETAYRVDVLLSHGPAIPVQELGDISYIRKNYDSVLDNRVSIPSIKN